MCSVSAVSDYYMNIYPQRLGGYQPMPGQINPFQGLGSPTQVVQSMDPEVKDMLRRALELLDRVDKRLGDIECMDEKKAAFTAALQQTPTSDHQS